MIKIYKFWNNEEEAFYGELEKEIDFEYKFKMKGSELWFKNCKLIVTIE